MTVQRAPLGQSEAADPASGGDTVALQPRVFPTAWFDCQYLRFLLLVPLELVICYPLAAQSPHWQSLTESLPDALLGRSSMQAGATA